MFWKGNRCCTLVFCCQYSSMNTVLFDRHTTTQLTCNVDWLQIEILPVNLFGQDPFHQSNIFTGQCKICSPPTPQHRQTHTHSYMLYVHTNNECILIDVLPENSNISLRCEAFPLPQNGMYNITITVELSEIFTPAVLNGIAAFELTRMQVIRREEGIPFFIENGSVVPLPAIRDIFNQTRTSNRADPLIDRSYQYVVSLKDGGRSGRLRERQKGRGAEGI